MKRIISAILTLSMLAAVLTVAPLTASAADISADTQTTQELSVTGDGTVGEIFSDEVNRSASTAANGITDVTITGDTATVALNNDTACMITVGIYDESGDTLITTATLRDIPEKAGTVDLSFDESLPRYFYLKAYILDPSGAPLAPQYESERYTREYAEFLNMTISDFPSGRVMNLDNNPDNNFAVLTDAAVRIATSSTANIPEKTDEDTYTFSQIDSSMRGLKEGDIFAFTLDGQEEVVKVASASYSGDTLTVTAAKAEMDEVFTYVKINTTSETPDDSPAQTGADDKSDPAATGEDVDFDITYSKTEKYEVGELPESTGMGISGSVTVGLTATVILYYYEDVREAALILDCGGNFNLTMLVKLEHSFTLGIIPVPTPIAGIVVQVKSELEIEAEAKVEINIPYKSRTGFRYSGQSGFHNLSTLPQFGFECSCEGKLYCGIKLTAAVNAYRVAEAGFYAKLGLEAVGTRMPTVSDYKDSDHLCRWCIEGNLSLVMSTGAEARFLSKKWEHEFGSMKDKLFDFHYSADNGFGKGPCKNRTEPKIQNYSPDIDNLPTEGNQTTSCSFSGTTGFVTLYVRVDGNGVFNCEKMMDDIDQFLLENETKYNEAVSEEAKRLYPDDGYEQAIYVREHERYHVGHKIYINGFSVVEPDFPYTFIEQVSGPCEYLFANAKEIPDTVRIIGGYPHPTYKIQSTELPSSLEYNGAVWENINSVVIPESLKGTIPDAFPNVETATLLSVVDSIFKDNKKLSNVTIGDNVTNISSYAFYGCTSLKSVTIPSSVTQIGNGAFAGSGIERIVIPGNVKRIDENAFADCTNLREVIIEDGVEEVDLYAFANCPNLERVVLPGSIAILNVNAFNGCGNVTIDYDGTVEQWLNIIAWYSCRYSTNTIYTGKMGDLTEASVFYQNCTILCYPNEDGDTIPAGTGLAATGAPVGATPDTYYRDTEYLIAIEDADNGRLQGGVSYLKQVKADENGELTYQLPDGSPGDGEYLNIYGACRHPSAHVDTSEGSYACICDICGASVPRIIYKTKQPTEPITGILGDADGDGEVSAMDATIMQRKIAGMPLPSYVEWNDLAGDVNADEDVDMIDVTLILRWLAGMNVKVPIGEAIS